MGEVTTLAKQEEIPRGYPEEADWEGGAGGAGGGRGGGEQCPTSHSE